ncbi:hypothetical protein [Aquimarina litoralis]|uniref:hypothetical protein n=1 Tax=Aquimarina litoralis TaxID=584605 RepID=UPI001C57FB1B|nr:hypothetical protein [Aquimarina litoralis]MBW1294567.1 hypothetical protein [Aquimarina litoralis]
MKNLRKYYGLVIMLSIVLGSCEKEDDADQVLLDENVTENTNAETDSNKISFVINDAGKQVSEEEYLKELADKRKTLSKSSNARYCRSLPSRDFHKYGLNLSKQSDLDAARYRGYRWLKDIMRVQDNIIINQNSNAKLLPNFSVNGQSYGYHTFDGTNYPTEICFIRESLSNGPEIRSLSHPTIEDSENKKGDPNMDVSLNGQKFGSVANKKSSSISRTKASTVNGSYTATATLDAKFFGVGTSISGAVMVGGATTNTNQTVEGEEVTRTKDILFSPGHIVPKGQQCDFLLYEEKRAAVTKYRVKQRIFGQVNYQYWTGDYYAAPNFRSKTYFSSNNYSAGFLFPTPVMQGKIYTDFETYDNYTHYSIERTNCRSL